jgi:hypothetical protein
MPRRDLDRAGDLTARAGVEEVKWFDTRGSTVMAARCSGLGSPARLCLSNFALFGGGERAHGQIRFAVDGVGATEKWDRRWSVQVDAHLCWMHGASSSSVSRFFVLPLRSAAVNVVPGETMC